MLFEGVKMVMLTDLSVKMLPKLLLWNNPGQYTGSTHVQRFRP